MVIEIVHVYTTFVIVYLLTKIMLYFISSVCFIARVSSLCFYLSRLLIIWCGREKGVCLLLFATKSESRVRAVTALGIVVFCRLWMIITHSVSERERERVCMCVCVCVCEGEREIESACVHGVLLVRLTLVAAMVYVESLCLPWVLLPPPPPQVV